MYAEPEPAHKILRGAVAVLFVFFVVTLMLLPDTTMNAITGFVFDPATMQLILRGYVQGAASYLYCALAILV